MQHRYQRHQWQDCHWCQWHWRQWHWRQICHRCQRYWRQICHWCQRRQWQIATDINDTGGKFATGVNDTSGKQWEQLSNYWQLKMNLKKRIYLTANFTTQRCPKGLIQNFLIENLFHSGGKPWAANISANFRKNSKRPCSALLRAKFYRTPARYTADRKTRRKRDMSCYGLLSAACHPSPSPPTFPLPTLCVCRTACGHVIRIIGLRESPPPHTPQRIMDRFWQPRPKSRMASILETVSMVAEFGQQRWLYTNFWCSDRTLRSRDRIFEFSQEMVKICAAA